ncbi:MAG: phosphotransferase [Desulfobacterales bacterium]|nr:phosphotransferase [Desulfobacterales bacterium]
MAALPPLVQAMLDPSFYPHDPEQVDLIQTHISYLFLCGELVYKVKKPVDFGFLDFTTLEKRGYFCQQEVRLNKRFSPDVYLDVVTISLVGDSFRLGDETAVIEYAVKMKRINEDHMLYRLLRAGKVGPETMRRIGGHLANAYAAIPSDEKARAFGALDVVSTNVVENFEQTRKYIGGPISKAAFESIERWSLSFMKKNRALFEQRVVQGCIKDCHGDLHLQHICVEGEHIYIFDCIEFNERFRFGDVASDVGFLAMDLDFNGYPDLAKIFVDAYIEAAGDLAAAGVLTFYKVYRAYVRAKVTSFMLDDSALDEKAKGEVLRQAKKYYDLALRYVRGDI